jgi:hypothetical protein
VPLLHERYRVSLSPGTQLHHIENTPNHLLSSHSMGCSPVGDNNKMAWKHGGSISDNNKILYKITPTQSRPPPPSAPVGHCKAPGFPRPFWAVSITGGGFLSGDHGDALEREFNNCGATTRFTFRYFDKPKEDGTEWEAYGQLPLFISSHCARRAIRRVGGFVNDQC